MTAPTEDNDRDPAAPHAAMPGQPLPGQPFQGQPFQGQQFQGQQFQGQPFQGQPFQGQQFQGQPFQGQQTSYPVSVAQYPVIMLPQHPQAVTILVLGILGYFTFITAPIAWVLGHRAEKEMAASGQRFANESWVKVGKLLGIVFTIVGALSIIAVIAYVIFIFSFMMSVLPSFPR